MDEFKIAERVLSKIAGRGKEYKEYFDKKLKKWNVSSPADIPEDKKDDFFEEIDAGWKADGEKKEASLMSLRDRRAGCEKLPEGGMRDNCEKKKKEEGDGKDKKAKEVISSDANYLKKQLKDIVVKQRKIIEDTSIMYEPSLKLKTVGGSGETKWTLISLDNLERIIKVIK